MVFKNLEKLFGRFGNIKSTGTEWYFIINKPPINFILYRVQHTIALDISILHDGHRGSVLWKYIFYFDSILKYMSNELLK